MQTATLPGAPDVQDFLPINGTDYVRFYVGNAKQAAHFYRTAFGFQPVAYSGLETGNRESTSFLLKQGKIRFLLTSSLVGDSEVAEHVKLHGDGVKDIALWVDDARSAYEETISRGAISVHEPRVLEDENGHVVIAAIRTYGDTIHTFVERSNYSGIFMPGFQAWETPDFSTADVGLQYLDHCVGNVHLGDMNRYADFYSDVLGFRNLLTFDDKDISTEYSALMSSDGQRQRSHQIPDQRARCR